jgi:hypothetical protein
MISGDARSARKLKRTVLTSAIALLLMGGCTLFLYKTRTIDFRISRRGWHLLTDIEYIQRADGTLERTGRFFQVGPVIVVCYYN